ncbi:MAG TPA: CHAT domain-containing tetratricopeptide repeat protein, partial [Pyrinomonadaceae bacterium]|nr:CHAT domain-containing tetratricopeptide repeat protein [Pyrinomonadaceae bacterium]
AMRNFWNPQSPNLSAHFRYYKGVMAHARLDLITPQVTKLQIDGDKAISYLTADERRFDKKTGAVLQTFDPYRGACRSFEWIKTSSGWQIQKQVLVQDELAGRLGAARSNQERDEILEKEKRFVGNTLVNALGTRALRHSTHAEYDLALNYIDLQRTIAERIGDQTGIAGSWLNTGIVKNSQDEHENSVTALLKALALYEASQNKLGVAMTQENLSNAYRALGDHRRAFDFAQKSLRLSEETNHRRGMMHALTELGIIYGQQGNAEQAFAHQERALAIAQELEDTLAIAMIRHDIAIQYNRFGQFDRSLALYEQLLKQVEGFGDRGGAAMVRDQIGKIYAELKRYDEALSYHQQALAGLDSSINRRAAVVTLNNISAVHLAQGNYTEALKVSGEAVGLVREKGRKGDLAVALINQGDAQFGLNRLVEARQSFSDAVAIIETLRTQTAGGFEERQRYFEHGLGAHHGLLSVLVKQDQPLEALTFAERAKARVLLDLLQQGRARVNKAMTAAEQNEELRLKTELTQLNKRLSRLTQSDKQDAALIGETEAKLEKTRLDYEAFQNSLYAAHPELKTHRGEAPIINAQELANLLPNTSSALLEYVVTDDATYLFTITKPAEKAPVEIEVQTLPLKRDELAKQIESFRQQLATRDLGFRAAAAKLYNLLLKPAQSQLQGKNNIVIAPDSSLWDLPFQALVNDANKFMIENASITYAPSLTVLREMTKRRVDQSTTQSPANLLAFGNPLSGSETTTRQPSRLRNHNFDPLPEAGEEVKALGRLYGASRSRIYVGNQAREDLLKNEAGSASILHFTTHGTLNNASPMYSHLMLAEGGANDDGLLEAWELMQLDLKAELAVLSACETARGRIGAGEGMIGFSWAMFIAGVPSIVVSQWKVESAGTRDLMVHFHRSLIGSARTKPAKSEALRQASLKLMRNPETSHPFYWAGFVLVGDAR